MDKEPIRIAQIIGKWVGGGVEATVMNYYRHIDRSKIQYDFICDSDSTNIPYEEIEKMGGRIILVPPYQKVFKYHKELKKIFEKEKYKIVHSHINTLSFFPLLAAKCAKVPIRIAHNHSTTNKKEWKKNIVKVLLRPLSKLVATDYFACTEHAGRWMFGNKAFDNNKVFVMNNAIDLEKFKFNDEIRKNKRKELKIKDDTIVIGHIGRFVAQKNHEFIIDVFNEFHKKNINSILLLIGQGPLMDKIKEKVCNNGLENNVIFLGQREDANELYQAMDLFLFPSLYEGLGMVAVEAQAAGLPCLCSTEVPEIVKAIDEVEFVELNQPKDYWVEKIEYLTTNNRRFNKIDKLSQRGYDIKQENNKLLNRYYDLNADYLIDKNEKIKYVSFDLYDTLIKRLVEPKEIYKMMEKILLSEKIGIDNFSEKRIKAEEITKKNIKYYNLDDIYNNDVFSNICDEILSKCKKIEEELEIKNSIISKRGKSIYDILSKRSKIIVISDMYLSSKVLKEILHKNNYNIDDIYVSCEIKKSKRDGNLYRYIKEKLKIKNGELIHVGDAFFSDFINARLNGFKTYFLGKNNRKNNIKQLDEKDYLNYLGENIFGPLLYGFCKEIKKKEKILFLAREGEFLKKCFELLYDTNSDIIYLSRNSVCAGIAYEMLKKNRITDLLNIMSISRTEDNYGILCRLGLDDNTIVEILKKENVDLYSQKYNELSDAFEKNKKIILPLIADNNAMFEKYIKQYSLSNVTLIDVGWKGSMQNLLNKYFEKTERNIIINGSYIGTLDRDKKSGYLFDCKNRTCDEVMCYSGIIELIMMPEYGSTIGYEYNKKEKNIIPKFAELEFTEKSYEKIKLIQNGILNYLKEIKKMEKFYDIEKNIILDKMNAFGNHPFYKEVTIFSDINFYDNKKNIYLIDTNIKNIVNNFLESKWKTGFLKKMFKVDFSYEKIVILLKKLKDR